MIPLVAILAGGVATRLRPITEKLPKGMIDIHNKPFLEYQLALLKQQGFENILLCVGFEGKQIETYFGNGSRFGVNIHYSYDGNKLLGTGGALKKALPLLSEIFIVIYGDSYLDEDYVLILNNFMQKYRGITNPPLALMTIFKNENQFDQSNVLFREGEIIKYDKKDTLAEMKHIDWGLGILSKKAFEEFSSLSQFDLADLYEHLVTQKKLVGFEVSKRFYEIGSFKGIEEFKKLIKRI